MIRFITASLLLTSMLMVMSAQAEIYKWVDEKGKVHYGDKPVANGKQMDIKEPAATKQSISQQERMEKRRRLMNALDEDRTARKEEQAKKRKQKARLNQQCANAKDRLRGYESAGSLYDLDKDGNRVTLSNAERKKTIDSLRANIKKHCK